MIYLDTSAAVPMFIREAASDSITDWLESRHDTLITSDWILTEFASALSMKVRRAELAQKHAKSAWEQFEAFANSGLRLIPVTRQAFTRAARLARDVRGALRAGDALHLAVAIEAGATSIATADGQLAKGASMHGLAVNRF